jgi:hypothetical protein
LNVLIYGGCHAVALRDLFRSNAPGSHHFDCLQNYELINSGTPFPYERLPQYDAVVYSPVRNKGEWNTDLLKARCDAIGVKTVSFPWLQFNGYFPDVTDAGVPPHLWTYQYFKHHAAAGQGLDELRTAAFAPETLNPFGYLDYAFSALAEHEGGLDISIGSFVRDNFRKRRLFWTPNHPTLVLYEYVQREIASRLGIALSGAMSREELHRDAFLIMPGVAQALELQFSGEEYRLETDRQGIGLNEFLALTLKLFGKVPAAV